MRIQFRHCLWSVFALFGLSLLGSGFASAATLRVDGPIERPLLLRWTDSNPRNSEGSFVKLQDGRILYIYSHFVGGGWDESPAYLAARYFP